jgi:SH3 domain
MCCETVQVKAAYKYQAEDVDELNFEVGEIIQVVEYDDPDEQVSICLLSEEFASTR